MNKHLNLRSLIAITFCTLTTCALCIVPLTLPIPALAQSAPSKIRLLADTLRARDSGNLIAAKSSAEDLIKLAPNDVNVQRLLASINDAIDARGPQMIYGLASVDPINQMTDVVDLDSITDGENLIAALEAEQDAKIAAAEAAIDEAEKLAELGAYTEANTTLSASAATLSLNAGTVDIIDSLNAAKADVILTEAFAQADSGELKQAEASLEAYAAAGGDSREATALQAKLDSSISDPDSLDINEISPEFVQNRKYIRELMAKGRRQFIDADYEGAAATFKEVEARDANNAAAKLFSKRIALVLGSVHRENLYKTRQQMITEVDQQWERPKVYDYDEGSVSQGSGPSAVQQKLTMIIIPQVNFSSMELTRVIETLSELSLEYDPERIGVNIVPLFNPNDSNPKVNISLRNLSLDRILQFVTQQVNFTYEVGIDAVTVAPSFGQAGAQSTITEFFPISAGTVIRLTGFGDGGGISSGPVDPFAPVTAASGPSSDDKTDALQAFFQRAGVNFELPGASLAFDGEQLIVTQSRQNLDRMRTILRNYNEVKQVEIEAKFLEVAQNDLEELGFNWTFGDGAVPQFDENFLPVLDSNGNQVNSYQRNSAVAGRTLNDAFATNASASSIQITGLDPIISAPPQIASRIDLAATAGNFFTANGWTLDGMDVTMAMRALSRKTGTDLMSAPKVTVLSGKRATITVAQELRYPESYGDIESTASSGRGSGGENSSSGAAISITAGTPEDFVTRNVGVELAVTPNVENDDTISLTLEPRVTEFEGFVEYGGPSIATTGGTTVTVPAGFYQPIFSTREVSTEVTVFDGATVVLGGLTRDEVKTVNDSVPILGDIPGVGRLFRSEGETRQKRNLLIFVTANLVSPGGSPARQSYPNVRANSMFQNPTIMTPSGTANRTVAEDISE
ncbi:MAG: type II secretory pathway, component PulD [Verrucomicrobiota bacterium]|nr:type II secretory pathway, component PulD [Verrucomicrobiota bacterium]